jgi:hypothetical protein
MEFWKGIWSYSHISILQIVPVHIKCWILLKPVLGGMDGSLHLTVPSMNRLNQTEPATFSILPCWTFFRDSYFLYLIESETLTEELNKMEFWKGIWSYEACISQIIRQKTNLKSGPHILRMIQQYSSEEYWNHLTGKKPKRKNLITTSTTIMSCWTILKQ